MIGGGRSVGVVGTGTTSDVVSQAVSSAVVGNGVTRDTSGDSVLASFGHLSVYAPAKTEGVDDKKQVRMWGRYLRAGDPAFTVRVQLDHPALGGEQVKVTETEENGLSLTGLLTTPGTTTYTLQRAQNCIEFTVTPSSTTQYFRPRRLIYELEPVFRSKVPANETKICVITLLAAQDPPTVTLSVGSGPYSAPGTLPLTYSMSAALFEATKIHVWLETNPGGELTTAATGASEHIFTVTAQTGNIYIDIPRNATAGAYRVRAAHPVNTKDSVGEKTVDPITQTYKTTDASFHEGSKFRWTNDLHRQQFENESYRDAIQADQFGGIGGYETTHNSGGVTALSETHTVRRDQSAASPIVDPVTGNALQYVIPSSDVQSGIPYLREGFDSMYEGGPACLLRMRGWIRVSYCVEPFKSEDNPTLVVTTNPANDDPGMLFTKQIPYFRVGYRVREATRNHGVSFEWRNTMPTSGYSKFGDQTKDSITFTFGTSTYVDCFDRPIRFIDTTGTLYAFSIASTPGGGGGGGTPTPSVYPPSGGTVPTSAAETALQLASLINTSAIQMTAVADGATLTVKQDNYAPNFGGFTLVDFTQDPVNGPADWCSALTISPVVNNIRLTNTALVDNAGNSIAPTLTGAGTTSSPIVVGSGGQYYFDSVTGVEVWFLKRYNLWNKHYNTSGTVTAPTGATGMLATGSHNQWGSWYGVERTRSGLCAYVNNYVPTAEPADPTSFTDDAYVYAWDLTTIDPQEGLDDDIGYNTFPPIAANRVSSATAAAEETAGAALTTTHGDLKGVEFDGAARHLQIAYPVWCSSSDRSNGKVGTRPYTLNSIRNNEIGMLWHSAQTQTADDTTSDPPWGSGAPEYQWQNQSPGYYPRGGCHTTNPRSSATFTIS